MNRTQSDVRRFVICPGSAALHSEIGVVHAAGLARLRSSRALSDEVQQVWPVLRRRTARSTSRAGTDHGGRIDRRRAAPLEMATRGASAMSTWS